MTGSWEPAHQPDAEKWIKPFHGLLSSWCGGISPGDGWRKLSALRNDGVNMTSGFNYIKEMRYVRGAYPEELLKAWESHHEAGDVTPIHSPHSFGDEQEFVLIEMAHAGLEIYRYEFKDGRQALSAFEQVMCSLAVAEQAIKFEHRDLHVGNILISATSGNEVHEFLLNGAEIDVESKGVKATIIDYTFSRMTGKDDDSTVFFDLGRYSSFFQHEGDYQHDIYRYMQSHNQNNWQEYKPYTNVLWAHYLLVKIIAQIEKSSGKGRNVNARPLKSLKRLEKNMLSYGSATEFVKHYFDIL